MYNTLPPPMWGALETGILGFAHPNTFLPPSLVWNIILCIPMYYMYMNMYMYITSLFDYFPFNYLLAVVAWNSKSPGGFFF